MTERFDLFGDPVPENFGGRGRPPHIATDKNRNKVSMLLAFGWSNERIAKALGVSPPTLRKVYFCELKARDDMRDRLDARIAEVLWEGVSEGNVAAVREFRKVLERNDLAVAGETYFRNQVAAPAKKEPKLGKKEVANQEALTGHQGTGWSSLLKQ